jgi:hypothetical protein
VKDRELRRLLARLQREVIFLRDAKQYGNVTFDEEAGTWVRIPNFPIGEQWYKLHIEILIDIPTHSPCYPLLHPDGFWTEKALRTRDGKKIRNFFPKDSHPTFREENWGKFSFHVKSWNPVTNPLAPFTRGDSLISYLNAIAALFQESPHIKEEGKEHAT